MDKNTKLRGEMNCLIIDNKDLKINYEEEVAKNNELNLEINNLKE